MMIYLRVETVSQVVVGGGGGVAHAAEIEMNIKAMYYVGLGLGWMPPMVKM